MTASKVVRLADLEAPVGEVLLPSGREVAVRAIDGRAYQISEAMANSTAQPGDAWKLAALLLPEATEDEILSLTPTAIGIVAQMASGQLEAVLALVKAADAAEGKATAPSPAAPSSAPVTG